MAPDLQPKNGKAQERPETPSHPGRHSSSKAATSRNKRLSRDGTVLHPDPFIFGHPNPLGSHPLFSDKPLDLIHRQDSTGSLQSLPAMDASSGSLGVAFCTHEDPLTVEQSLDSLGKSARVDSVIPVDAPVNENEFVRGASPVKEIDKAPISTTEKSSVQSLFVHKDNSTAGTELTEFIKNHEEANIRDNNEANKSSTAQRPVCAPTPAEERPHPAAQRGRSYVGAARSMVSGSSGLPPVWTHIQDRFIAYLDTHAPLTKEGSIPKNEWECERYTAQEMLDLLHERFEKFRGFTIPDWAIERRLRILDLRENNYFNMPYGCYKFEEWGKSI